MVLSLGFITLVGFIVGAVLGSFIKAMADRSLLNRSFLGRSKCEKCKKDIPWYDLIPIFSFLALRGKCRSCGKDIGKDYLYVEVLSGLIFGLVFYQASLSFPGVEDTLKLILFIFDLNINAFFVVVLLILTITDLKKMLIPDRIVLPSSLILLTLLVLLAIYKIWYLYYSLSSNLIGQFLLPPYSDYFYRHALLILDPLKWSVVMGFLISGFFLLLIVLTRGKGMGGGDVKLGLFIGLGLGFPNSLVALMLAFFSGALISLLLVILKKRSFGQSVPFGPFLVLGSLVALLWGERIVNWYINLIY